MAGSENPIVDQQLDQQEGILRAHASMWASEHKGNVLPWIVYIIVHYLWPKFSLRVKRILGFICGIPS